MYQLTKNTCTLPVRQIAKENIRKIFWKTTTTTRIAMIEFECKNPLDEIYIGTKWSKKEDEIHFSIGFGTEYKNKSFHENVKSFYNNHKSGINLTYALWTLRMEKIMLVALLYVDVLLLFLPILCTLITSPLT